MDSSDRRFKRDITPISGALDTVIRLQGVNNRISGCTSLSDDGGDDDDDDGGDDDDDDGGGGDDDDDGGGDDDGNDGLL